MLETRIERFLHAEKLGAPQVADVVEALIHGFKAPVGSAEAAPLISRPAWNFASTFPILELI
jgi:hypothetical protein